MLARVFGTTRMKLVASFLAVSFIVGGVSLLVGGELLYQAFLSEARSRIRLDLNAAREIYEQRTKSVELALSVASLGSDFEADLASRNGTGLVPTLRKVARRAELDFAGVALPDGTVLCRTGLALSASERTPAPALTHLAARQGKTISGTVVLDLEQLGRENPALVERARIEIASDPGGKRESVTEAMVLAAAVPVYSGGSIIGVTYGGVLLNRSHYIVDRVRDTVFRHETFEGRSIGTTTIFLGDVRISTNVLDAGGRRAVGTRVSKEVEKEVLEGGRTWMDRAMVVNDWYITSYEPIEDVEGDRVGMLYVGVLEAKYASVRDKALGVFALFTLVGLVVAIGLGYLLERRIMRPVHRLIVAAAEVEKGNLEPEIKHVGKGELGDLSKTFSDMLVSLRERDARIQAESESRLQHYEKQASVGRLAAGVAHEINNPLTGVLTFTHMLLRREDISDDMRADLRMILEQTERVRKIVKGLLDFSRQTRLDKEPTDIVKLVRSSLELVENESLVRGVTLRFEPGDGLPVLTVDRNLMQSVFLNILINALDATRPGGEVRVSTSLTISPGEGGGKGVEIVVSDTGCGIPPENMHKLFDPFFTTKEVGQGTGLGLSVSFGIVRRHGGDIRVASEQGKGSTFIVWLPASEKDNEEANTGG